MENEEITQMITVNELMGLLKISRQTAYRYIEAKKFEVYKFGKTLRISKQSVLDFLSEHKI